MKLRLEPLSSTSIAPAKMGAPPVTQKIHLENPSNVSPFFLCFSFFFFPFFSRNFNLAMVLHRVLSGSATRSTTRSPAKMWRTKASSPTSQPFECHAQNKM